MAATTNNMFDDNTLPLEGPWITTYSRALSIYPNEEDHCWDRLAHTSSIFTKLPDDSNTSSTPTTVPSSFSRQLERTLSGSAISQRELRQNAKKQQNSSNNNYRNDSLVKPTSPSISAKEKGATSSIANSMTLSMPAPSTTTTIETSMIYDLDAGVVGMDDETLPIMSPGRISHALCKIGFDCIDYFTATTDDALDAAMEKQKRPRPSHRSNVSSLDPYIRSTGLRDDELNQDWQTGLAAAVGGKRTAALERKRARSRTMSVDQLSSYGSTRDPWFETLDRLSRWDEIVRK